MIKFLASLLVLLFIAPSVICKAKSNQAEVVTYVPQKRDFKTFTEDKRDSSHGKLEDLVKGLKFTDHHPELLRASIVHFLSPAWASLDKRIAQSEGFDTLTNFFGSLEKVGGTITCAWDQSLNNGTRLLQKKRVFIAANFKDNQEVLPHLLVQIWHTIALLEPGNVFVSIYESSSHDSTAFWLDKFAELFEALKVPNRIKKDGAISHAGGNLVSRIELLHRVRNAALEPLWDGEGLWHEEDSDPESEAHLNLHLRKRHPRVKRRLAQLPPTHILFTNDVYACARDNIRLLYHDADVACGTDWYPQEGMLTFYDIWVARDIQGFRLQWHPPYVKDKFSQQRMKEGLHVPVQSCWNGVAVIKAAPFMNHGLKFRTSRPGECLASECKLICDDLRELGFPNIVMDPGVRLAYSIQDAVDAFKSHRVADIAVTDWADIRNSPIDILNFGQSDASDCCATNPEQTFVKWSECEHRVDRKRSAKSLF